ncbi:hypothetical protein EX895_003424 [Sporisorium graminicola]|uniref:Uncharacterized protein n=1 Tax=Sporisorium graminicola TaxID=280036 RepID=A0A4U7KTN9_9BASI|nr:hypothetical protein EX895_003424 [Sporisorium graminicola]TKY87843.1 hypothetical protein EX895_003424 [Sporisorium graminicola]
MLSISLFRTVALRNAAASVAAAKGARNFSYTAVAMSAVKPGSESEATSPGSGSTEEIANSEGAYDGSSTNPSTSTSQIENETDADFGSSSANAETSEMATKAQHQSNRRPSKQQQSTPDKSNFGATEARKQGGRGGGQS